MDIFTKKKRSYIMSRIRSRDTKPELFLMNILNENNVDFVYQPKEIFGRPDFVVGNTTIFVDGDFWHLRKPLSLLKMKRYWKRKLLRNKVRDIKVSMLLRLSGYRVIRIWETDLFKIGSRIMKYL